MEEIGLFPLGLVLLPTEQVPLHIFEPRYRELIAECLENEQPFGLVYADDDGLRRTGTFASVVEVVDQFEDGRLNIVVEGGDRFRLVELTDGSARTMRAIRRNLGISIFYNATAATLAVLGLVGPLLAALVMPLSSLTVVAFSLRARTFERGAQPTPQSQAPRSRP